MYNTRDRYPFTLGVLSPHAPQAIGECHLSELPRGICWKYLPSPQQQQQPVPFPYKMIAPGGLNWPIGHCLWICPQRENCGCFWELKPARELWELRLLPGVLG